jgi:hypothetical protein
VYSLAQLTHHLTYFYSHDENRNLTAIGLKNSSYLASILIIVANSSLAVLKYLQEKDNLELSPRSERLLVILLNILTHVGSGLLQRNALLIVRNPSIARHQRLMAALYALLISAAPIYTVPVQTMLIEKYGLATTLAITSLFMLTLLPLFAFENVRELYGEKKFKDVKSPTKKKKENHDLVQTKSKLQRLLDYLKIGSYFSLLFVTYTTKNVLQAQQYSAMVSQQLSQGVGRTAATAKVALFVSLTTAMNLLVTRALNLSSWFTGSTRKVYPNKPPRGNITLLLLSQSAALLGATFSNDHRLYPFFVGVLNVVTTLLQQHLSREFINSKDGKELVQSSHLLTKIQMVIIPILASIMPALLSMTGQELLSKKIVKLDKYRINFALVLLGQVLASLFFLL